ncbi:MAG: sigma-70 family RNA polymerase sigma factor [Bacteroidales bacterium]|nr:sigma-70 family RNA polymerase sigma factor [Bacteroidales bacterium]
MEEKDLAEACRRGEDGAYKEFYDRYSRPLYGVCRRYLGNSADADDVFQDGLIKIISAFGKFSYRGDGSLKAWASRVMVNTALMHLRERLKADVLSEEPVPDETAAEDPEVSDIPTEVLHGFILSLPDGYRAVLNMYAFEKMSHKEIARALGISERTSASQFLRAKRSLAKKINEYRKNGQSGK